MEQAAAVGERNMDLLDLPNDILTLITLNLDLRSEAISKSVCKELCNIISDPLYRSAKNDTAWVHAEEPVYCPILIPEKREKYLRGWDIVARKWCNLPSLGFLPEAVKFRRLVANSGCYTSSCGLLYLCFEPDPADMIDEEPLEPYLRYEEPFLCYVCNLLTGSYIEVEKPPSDEPVWISGRAHLGVPGFTLVVDTSTGLQKLESSDLAGGWVDLPWPPQTMPLAQLGMQMAALRNAQLDMGMVQIPLATPSLTALVGRAIFKMFPVPGRWEDTFLLLTIYHIDTMTWEEHAIPEIPQSHLYQLQLVNAEGQLWLVRWPVFGSQPIRERRMRNAIPIHEANPISFYKYDAEDNRFRCVETYKTTHDYHIVARDCKSTIVLEAEDDGKQITYNVVTARLSEHEIVADAPFDYRGGSLSLSVI